MEQLQTPERDEDLCNSRSTRAWVWTMASFKRLLAMTVPAGRLCAGAGRVARTRFKRLFAIKALASSLFFQCAPSRLSDNTPTFSSITCK